MKVSFLMGSVSRNGGGVTDAAMFLSHSLSNHGVEMSVHGLQDCDSEKDLTRWAPVVPVVHKTRWGNTLGYTPNYYKGLCKSNPDLAHCHVLWKYPSVACQRWSDRQKSRYLISPHGMLDKWALKQSSWKKRVVRVAFQEKHLKNAACIHALCDAEREAIRSFGLTNPVCVIPNGVHLPSERPAPPPRWSHLIAPDSGVLLFLGRLHPKKGLANFLRAWQRNHDSTRNKWSLVIAGWDQLNHEQELREITATYGLKNVHFVGPLFGDEKDASFRHADAFVLPSLSEGLPVSILEAWSYRKPVLMTDECNLPEAIHAQAGIVVKANSDSLGKGLRTLLDMTTEEYQTMGNNGYNLVKEKFTWDRVGCEMKNVYDWITNGGAIPSSVMH